MTEPQKSGMFLRDNLIEALQAECKKVEDLERQLEDMRRPIPETEDFFLRELAEGGTLKEQAERIAREFHWYREFFNKRVQALESLAEKINEALEDYGEHSKECIISSCRAGRPTKDGGYEHLLGYGKKEKWYRSSPINEFPKCECGFQEALDLFKAWKERK